jgi:ubiquinone/menaquinone biosynthesis C-methylase UbiE
MPTKSEIYDHVYGEQVYEVQTGIVASLYSKLKKHEVNRYATCLAFLPPKTQRLLDVGCGGGHFAKEARGRVVEYYGVDVSPVLLERARANLTSVSDECRIHLAQCDIDQVLPFEDGFFDAVTCIAVLEHVMNPPSVIDEIHRVLKANGVFVLEVPNVAWLPYRIGLLFGRLPTSGGIYLGADWEHLHIFTKKLVMELITSRGFEIEAVSCSGIFARYRRWWGSLLGGDIIVKCKKTEPHQLLSIEENTNAHSDFQPSNPP